MRVLILTGGHNPRGVWDTLDSAATQLFRGLKVLAIDAASDPPIGECLGLSGLPVWELFTKRYPFVEPELIRVETQEWSSAIAEQAGKHGAEYFSIIEPGDLFVPQGLNHLVFALDSRPMCEGAIGRNLVELRVPHGQPPPKLAPMHRLSGSLWRTSTLTERGLAALASSRIAAVQAETVRTREVYVD